MTPRAVLIVLAIVALGAAIASIYGFGRESAETDIDQQNQEAGDAANQASSVFERCMDAGGVFDFAAGQCRGH